MSQKERPPEPADLPTLVAVSLLRGGLDALAARHAKAILPERPRSEWLGAIACELWADPSDQQRHIGWAMDRVDESLMLAARLGHEVLTCFDQAYPDLLRAIPDPPVILWTHGKNGLLGTPAVAVVGSRDATPTSLAVARKLGRQLAQAGLTVVSGLARGVDAAAHVGALEGGGPTIAVLGSGLNRIYPKQHSSLAQQIRASGAVISELPANTLPFPQHFPLRNRIISGLCRATVVVEACGTESVR